MITSSPPEQEGGEEYRFARANGYKHLYYNRGEMTLALTTASVTLLERVITFAYLFIVILLYSFAVLIIFTTASGRAAELQHLPEKAPAVICGRSVGCVHNYHCGSPDAEHEAVQNQSHEGDT